MLTTCVATVEMLMAKEVWKIFNSDQLSKLKLHQQKTILWRDRWASDHLKSETASLC
jgi:hypothetical protein